MGVTEIGDKATRTMENEGNMNQEMMEEIRKISREIHGIYISVTILATLAVIGAVLTFFTLFM